MGYQGTEGVQSRFSSFSVYRPQTGHTDDLSMDVNAMSLSLEGGPTRLAQSCLECRKSKRQVKALKD